MCNVFSAIILYSAKFLLEKKNTFLWSEMGYITCFSVAIPVWKSGHVEMQLHDLVALTVNYTSFSWQYMEVEFGPVDER